MFIPYNSEICTCFGLHSRQSVPISAPPHPTPYFILLSLSMVHCIHVYLSLEFINKKKKIDVTLCDLD